MRQVAENQFARQSRDHTLSVTALINETYLKITGDNDRKRRIAGWDPEHFSAVAALAVRQILVDHARAKGRQKRGDGTKPVSLLPDDCGYATPVDVMEINDCLNKMERMDPLTAKIVQLRFFGEMKPEQVTRVLGISLDTYYRKWTAARAWLARELSS